MAPATPLRVRKKSKCRPEGGARTIYISASDVNQSTWQSTVSAPADRWQSTLAVESSARVAAEPIFAAFAVHKPVDATAVPVSWGKPKKGITLIPLTLVTESGGH
jgi:hypothetical protein